MIRCITYTTNIKPTGNDIICSIKLSNDKIEKLHNITNLEKAIPNKKCSYIFNNKSINESEYCGTRSRYKLNEAGTHTTPECKNVDVSTCCEITPAKCSSVKLALENFCDSSDLRWSKSSNNKN